MASVGLPVSGPDTHVRGEASCPGLCPTCLLPFSLTGIQASSGHSLDRKEEAALQSNAVRVGLGHVQGSLWDLGL